MRDTVQPLFVFRFLQKQELFSFKLGFNEQILWPLKNNQTLADCSWVKLT